MPTPATGGCCGLRRAATASTITDSGVRQMTMADSGVRQIIRAPLSTAIRPIPPIPTIAVTAGVAILARLLAMLGPIAIGAGVVKAAAAAVGVTREEDVHAHSSG